MCNCNKGSAPIKKNTIRNGPKAVFPKASLLKKKFVPASSSVQNNDPIADLPGETLEEKCQTFAYMLGLDNPVPQRVLVAAMENPGYGRRLLSSRENEMVLYDLLNNPPVSNAVTEFSNGALLSKASKALLKWAVSGFPTVSKTVLKKREDACLGCPNLVEPTTLLQRYSAPSTTSNVAGERTGNAVCSSCGCVVRNKIRLATETCPELAAGVEKVSRWGETVEQ